MLTLSCCNSTPTKVPKRCAGALRAALRVPLSSSFEACCPFSVPPPHRWLWCWALCAFRFDNKGLIAEDPVQGGLPLDTRLFLDGGLPPSLEGVAYCLLRPVCFVITKAQPACTACYAPRCFVSTKGFLAFACCSFCQLPRPRPPYFGFA